MNRLIQSVAGEYRRYHALGTAALAQVNEAQLCVPGPANGNSLATIVWHLSGNLQSRFTDFLTDDGEKPWRNREEEFAHRDVSRAELMEKWERGWRVLFDTLESLTDSDLVRDVHIRRQPLAVHEALHRSLAHASYHVGQIVYVAHAHVGESWTYLSIAPGQSDAYLADPKAEKPADHAKRLTGTIRVT